MRRLLSIALLLVLGLPLFASAVTNAQAGKLPVCCRRAGAHHCMEMAAPNPSGQPSLRATCPAFPRAFSTAATASWSLPPSASSIQRTVLRAQASRPAVLGYRLEPGPASPLRGPPAGTHQA